jgi:hypothetical protein
MEILSKHFLLHNHPWDVGLSQFLHTQSHTNALKCPSTESLCGKLIT